MPEEKNSGTAPKKKRAAKGTAVKKSSARKRAVKSSSASATSPTASPATAPQPASGDRLTEVARTIGSTVGDIVKKTKRVLRREP